MTDTNTIRMIRNYAAQTPHYELCLDCGHKSMGIPDDNQDVFRCKHCGREEPIVDNPAPPKPMNEDEWFKAVKAKVAELHAVAHGAPHTSRDAEVLSAYLNYTVDALDYLVGCNSWASKQLIPYDAREFGEKMGFVLRLLSVG